MIHSEGFYTKPSLKWGQLLLPGGINLSKRRFEIHIRRVIFDLLCDNS